jgi:hypothetical protein
MRAEPVVEARALQPVAVSDLDGIDLCPVERPGDLLDVVEPVLVADGVHPVAQGDVLDVEFGGGGIQGHAGTPRRATIFSAVFSAAEVMMSRLPA